MALKRAVLRSLDRIITSPSNLAVVLCISPFAFYAFIAKAIGIPFASWWLVFPSLASAALFVVVGIRALKWGSRLMRPTDQARSRWNRKHLGKDYQ